MSSDSEEPFEDSFIDPAVLLGVWADATRVHVGRGEFTRQYAERAMPWEPNDD